MLVGRRAVVLAVVAAGVSSLARADVLPPGYENTPNAHCTTGEQCKDGAFCERFGPANPKAKDIKAIKAADSCRAKLLNKGFELRCSPGSPSQGGRELYCPPGQQGTWKPDPSVPTGWDAGKKSGCTGCAVDPPSPDGAGVALSLALLLLAVRRRRERPGRKPARRRSGSA